jgi:hypothetical protein
MDLEGLVRSRGCSGEGATKTSEGRRASKHSDSFEQLPGRTEDLEVAPETVNDEEEAGKANQPLRSTRPQEGSG